MITNYDSVKEAWDILQTHFGGSGDMKRTKIVILTSKFEELKMREDENLYEYFTKLHDISNEAFALGKHLSDTKMVRKIFRSLPDRFQPKLMAIEENKNLETMKVEEFTGSLQTYEINIMHRKKDKSIALKATFEPFVSENGNLDDELALLSKNFNKFFKKCADNLRRAIQVNVRPLPLNLIFLKTKRKVFNIGSVNVMVTYKLNVSTP